MVSDSINNKKLFAKAPSQIIRLLFLFMVSITIMTIDYRYKKLETARTWISSALYPIYFAAEAPIQISDWLADLFTNKSQLKASIDALLVENLFLKKNLQKTRYINAENIRLRSMLKMSSLLLNDDAQIAEIMHIEQKDINNELTINKGLEDKVYIGQPVLNTNGVIGQINHVALKSSTVLLLTSTRHALPVQIGPTAYRSIAQGNGTQSSLRLRRVLPNANLKLGNQVETSGIGGVFPPGYPVGVIDHISDNQQFAQITVKSYAEDSQLREVLLIWPASKQELKNATD